MSKEFSDMEAFAGLKYESETFLLTQVSNM